KVGIPGSTWPSRDLLRCGRGPTRPSGRRLRRWVEQQPLVHVAAQVHHHRVPVEEGGEGAAGALVARREQLRAPGVGRVGDSQVAPGDRAFGQPPQARTLTPAGDTRTRLARTYRPTA